MFGDRVSDTTGVRLTAREGPLPLPVRFDREPIGAERGLEIEDMLGVLRTARSGSTMVFRGEAMPAEERGIDWMVGESIRVGDTERIDGFMPSRAIDEARGVWPVIGDCSRLGISMDGMRVGVVRTPVGVWPMTLCGL